MKALEKLENSGYAFKVMLDSGDGEDYAGCKLWLVLGGKGVILSLPPIIRPDERQKKANWDAATVARLGRNHYTIYNERRYGVYLFDNHLNICYGRGDANFDRDIFGTEQRWSCFLPWNEQRHVRHSLYGLKGEHFYSQFDDPAGFVMGENSKPSRDYRKHGFSSSYDMFRAVEACCAKVSFRFRDFDGEEITATTHIEEREWRRGTGWFKFLSFFFPPLIKRSLEIHFSAEVGPRKGSYKGGTIGHSIEMPQGELHESAFRRYCNKHNLTLLQVERPQYQKVVPGLAGNP